MARFVLTALCEQDDCSPLVGWLSETQWNEGQMPAAEQVAIAVHLLRHGMVGIAKPGRAASKAAAEFVAADYVTAARVHLGMSAADAQALSMTEFQALFEMKFPESAKKERDVPTREEYMASMRAME